ncbi:unannotated protein [freshwater metagenome]|uniref:Unannotated protein n=1 Tax=freshwater metagenome TaxID=449393 RepID=A0A6J7ITD1_9ZZZZ|nr:META domain-containing protein [Actinomycetota bacterium]
MRACRLPLHLVAAAALALPLTACGGGPSGGGPGATALTAGPWQAASVRWDGADRPVIEGTVLTLRFDAGGQASGSGGCNTFGGPYALDGGQLRIGPLAATLRACAGPAGANEQEAGYFAALGSVRGLRLAGGLLTLLDARGRTAVTLRRGRLAPIG